MKRSRREKLLLLLLLVVGAYALGDTLARLDAPYGGYEGSSAIVVIPQGVGPATVASILSDARVIRSALQFRLIARLHAASGALKAGEYLFDAPLTATQVLDRIVHGDVLLHRVTIPEGLTGREILELIARQRLAAAGELEKAFHDAAPIHSIDPGASDLEGYLFPETYRFARGTSASRILQEMASRFRQVFDRGMIERAAEMRMSPRQVVTLASLIEKETSVAAERPLVSAVFHNRLRAGMPLQCDPTVIYALVSAGRYGGGLKAEDLAFVSPYNTYIAGGLPPGPIASPGRASLEAALHPAASRALYFVADGRGGHHFSDTLGEHTRAVEQYRRLTRRGA